MTVNGSLLPHMLNASNPKIELLNDEVTVNDAGGGCCGDEQGRRLGHDGLGVTAHHARASGVPPRFSTERFARETALAARLQDPHIVPILATGVADGLPFYRMPLSRARRQAGAALASSD